MSDRLRSLQRIVAVRAQMARLAEWRLAGSEAALRRSEEARSAIEGYLAEPDLGASLSGLAHTQARRLAVRVEAEAADRDRQRRARDAAEQRLRAATKHTDALARTEREVAERRDLERMIEAAAQRRLDEEDEAAP